MTKINFLFENDLIVGFVSKGHANTAEIGSDVLCAGISSALYLTANTITEIYGLTPKLSVEDGFFSLELSKTAAKECQQILKGLMLHIKALEKDYPNNLNTSTKQIA